MDPYEVRRRQIDRRREAIVRSFPNLWSQMIAGWQQPATDDQAWLMYSASYLVRTGGVHWAIDPVRFSHRVPGAPAIDFGKDLSSLSFVLLTHRHADHLDLDLLRALKDLPILWVIPEPMVSLVQREAAIPAQRLIVPKPLEPLHIRDLTITPFEGLHWERFAAGESGVPQGVPATGYLVEFSGKRWLFPSDIRNLNAGKLPPFGPADGLFAHLWLGRGSALLKEPPLLDAFCEFILALRPRHVILTHLEEFGRDPRDYWDGRHADRVCLRLRESAPGTLVTTAFMGKSVSL